MTTRIKNAFDKEELEGTKFFGKPVLELDREQLLSLVVHMQQELFRHRVCRCRLSSE